MRQGAGIRDGENTNIQGGKYSAATHKRLGHTLDNPGLTTGRIHKTQNFRLILLLSKIMLFRLLRHGRIDYLAHLLSAVMFSQRCTQDRKSTRLNSSHVAISYAVFCLKKKTP